MMRTIMGILFAWGWSVLMLTAEAVDAVDGAPARATTMEAQCAPVFSDHAIFQQKIPVPIWGWSLPGAKVTVAFDKQSKTTVAGKDGRWDVALDPMTADKLGSVNEAPEGKTLTIVSELDGKKASKAFKNILIGEVWLCSGQSNMAGRFGRDPYPRGSLGLADYPALRGLEEEKWVTSTPQTAGRFSRVGFCFARQVQSEIMVPVGLMIAATGGSPIESWMRTVPQELQNPKAKSVAGKPRRLTNYETKIAPLVGYGMRGAIWYQGEGNAKEGRE
jgi:sialate O-acetylesterase